MIIKESVFDYVLQFLKGNHFVLLMFNFINFYNYKRQSNKLVNILKRRLKEPWFLMRIQSKGFLMQRWIFFYMGQELQERQLFWKKYFRKLISIIFTLIAQWETKKLTFFVISTTKWINSSEGKWSKSQWRF